MISQSTPRALRPLTVPLDALWRLCVSPWAAIALSAAAATLIALGLVLPQAPANAAGDPQALAHWLADQQLRQGAWLSWAARAGLLTIYSSPLFRLVWAALGFTALIVTGDRFLAWRARATGQHLTWRTLAHVGLLVLLLGTLVEERWGWEQERTLLDNNKPVAVGPVAASLDLQRVGGEAAASESVRVLWRQRQGQGEARLVPGRPLIVRGLTVHLQEAGPAVRLRVVDATGQRVPLDDPAAGARLLPDVTLRFPAGAEPRYLGVPARDWTLWVAYRPSAMAGAPFALRVYRGAQADLLAQAPMAGKGELAVGEARVLWEVLPYAEIRAALHPGLGLWVTGWLLICLGLGAGALRFRPPRLGLALALGLGALLWLAAGGWAWLIITPLGSIALLAMAWTAALLLAAIAVSKPFDFALGWATLAWTVGGGLATLAQWAARGSLWGWDAWQAWWALVWCLLIGARHVRGRPNRWLAAAGLAAIAALCLYVIFVCPGIGYG